MKRVLTVSHAVFNMRSVFTDNNSPIVQLVERRTVNPYVAGSSPAWGAIVLISIPFFVFIIIQAISKQLLISVFYFQHTYQSFNYP